MPSKLKNELLESYGGKESTGLVILLIINFTEEAVQEIEQALRLIKTAGENKTLDVHRLEGLYTGKG